MNELSKNNYQSVRTLNKVIKLDNIKNNRENKIINLTTDLDADYIIGEISKAIENDFNLVFVSHKLGDTNDGTGMYFKSKEFEKIVEYIHKNSSKVEVLTYSEFLKSDTKSKR